MKEIGSPIAKSLKDKRDKWKRRSVERWGNTKEADVKSLTKSPSSKQCVSRPETVVKPEPISSSKKLRKRPLLPISFEKENIEKIFEALGERVREGVVWREQDDKLVVVFYGRPSLIRESGLEVGVKLL